MDGVRRVGGFGRGLLSLITNNLPSHTFPAAAGSYKRKRSLGYLMSKIEHKIKFYSFRVEDDGIY